MGNSAINKIKIPKIIHFIWAGGEKLLDNTSIDVIIEWAAENKDWEIYLWVDEATCKKDISTSYHISFNKRLKEYRANKEQEPKYAKILSTGIEKVKIINQSNKHNFGEKKPEKLYITIKDITKEKMVSSNIRYEIDKIDPNYGASSDLLRYKILHTYGGAYFDTDVSPGKTPLSEIDCEPKQHTLYVDHCTQKHNPSLEEIFHFPTKHIGNDTFICTTGNPLMLKLYETSIEHYNKDGATSLYYVYRAYMSMRDITIATTGPVLVKNVIKENLKNNSNGANEILLKNNVVLKRTRDGEIELARPFPKNTTHWLKPKAFPLLLEEIRKKIEYTIDFELKNFGVIRIDDHIDYLSSFINKNNIQNKNPVDIILKLAEQKLKSKDIKCVKIIGKYKETVLLARKYQLPNIFNLKNAELKEAVNHYLSSGIVKQASENQALLTRLSKVREMVKDTNGTDNERQYIEAGKQDIKRINEEYDIIYEKIKNLANHFQDSPNEELKIILIEKLETYINNYNKFMDNENQGELIRSELMLELKESISNTLEQTNAVSATSNSFYYTK